jgi:hypothetical protein
MTVGLVGERGNVFSELKAVGVKQLWTISRVCPRILVETPSEYKQFISVTA